MREHETKGIAPAMTAPEKATVLNGYRDRLTSKLSFSKLREAVRILGANLPTKLDWMEKTAVFGALGITWNDIKDDVNPAPQDQKDMLSWHEYEQRLTRSDEDALDYPGLFAGTWVHWGRAPFAPLIDTVSTPGS